MKNLQIKMTPTDSRLEEVVTDKHEVEVYPDTYQVEVAGDWYKTINMELLVDDPIENVTVQLDYRDYLEGDTGSGRVLQWAESHELIMEGVIDVGGSN